MRALCKIRDIYRFINGFENQFQERCGLGLNEGMLLCCISKFKHCSSGEIAQLLGISNSNTSKVISSVEKKGLIKRIVGEKDKRQMRFSLTPEGCKKLEYIKCNTTEIETVLKRINTM